MDHTQARQILTSLVEGFLPGSNEPIPTDSIVHQSDVLRAMLLSISVLDSAIARLKRRALLPDNVGRSWTVPEQERLRAEFRAKVPIEAIAARHGRTLCAVEARLQQLGLITAEERTTRGGFWSQE